jgi:hypothetical protein
MNSIQDLDFIILWIFVILTKGKYNELQSENLHTDWIHHCPCPYFFFKFFKTLKLEVLKFEKRKRKPGDEVQPRQCPCLGLSIHGERVGVSGFDGFRQKHDAHENLPRYCLPESKNLHPACLILYYLYSWSCYNGAQMRSGGGGRRRCG